MERRGRKRKKDAGSPWVRPCLVAPGIQGFRRSNEHRAQTRRDAPGQPAATQTSWFRAGRAVDFIGRSDQNADGRVIASGNYGAGGAGFGRKIRKASAMRRFARRTEDCPPNADNRSGLAGEDGWEELGQVHVRSVSSGGRENQTQEKLNS